jgi:hypothetical protein
VLASKGEIQGKAVATVTVTVSVSAVGLGAVRNVDLLVHADDVVQDVPQGTT